jgi:hypothetical protein
MLRAAVATLVVIGLGHSAHTLGGGAGPQPLAVAVLAVLVGPVVWAVVRHRTSAARMAVAMGAGQIVTHLALVSMAPGQGNAVAAHAHGDSALSAAASAAGADLVSTLHPTPTMLTAHALATALAALVLSHGADAVRAVARGILPARPVTKAPAGWRPSAPMPHVGVLTGRAVRPVGGRGPPLAAS